MGQPLPIDHRLAGVIKAAIDAKGDTLRDVSDATFIPVATLHRRLHGATFHVTELARIAAYLDTTPSALMAEAEGVAA